MRNDHQAYIQEMIGMVSQENEVRGTAIDVDKLYDVILPEPGDIACDLISHDLAVNR